MRASKQVMIVMALFTVGVLTLRAPGSEQTASKSPSNTRQMRCVVKVTADPDVLPLSFELAESLVRSDAVAGAAGRSTWSKGHGAPDVYLDIQPVEDLDSSPPEIVDALPTQARRVLFGLQIRVHGDVKPAAREFGSALMENLRIELQKAFAAHREDLQ